MNFLFLIYPLCKENIRRIFVNKKLCLLLAILYYIWYNLYVNMIIARKMRSGRNKR